MKIDADERVKTAVDYLDQGYTCAQAVVLTFIDLFDIDRDSALKFTASFGSGIANLREVCGAVSGMVMILGWVYPYEFGDRAGKRNNYAQVKRCVLTFKERMGGSYICAELLKIRLEEKEPVPTDEIINKYAHRPCSRSVANAALIVCEEINSLEN